jgi:hypothetical protein
MARTDHLDSPVPIRLILDALEDSDHVFEDGTVFGSSYRDLQVLACDPSGRLAPDVEELFAFDEEEREAPRDEAQALIRDPFYPELPDGPELDDPGMRARFVQ